MHSWKLRTRLRLRQAIFTHKAARTYLRISDVSCRVWCTGWYVIFPCILHNYNFCCSNLHQQTFIVNFWGWESSAMLIVCTSLIEWMLRRRWLHSFCWMEMTDGKRCSSAKTEEARILRRSRGFRRAGRASCRHRAQCLSKASSVRMTANKQGTD